MKGLLKINRLLTIFIMLFIVLIFQYAGRFLFIPGENFPQKIEPVPTSGARPDKAKGLPVVHRQDTLSLEGRRQMLNILEVDLKYDRVEVKPVLSFDSVFGFEKLSEIFKRTSPYAAVNAGFFHNYGQPSGMVMIDGELVTRPTGKYPVLVIRKGTAYLSKMQLKLFAGNGNKRVILDDINREGSPNKLIAYTGYYGTGSRSEIVNTTFTIENDKVISIKQFEGAAPIPPNGFIISFFGPKNKAVGKIDFNIGDRVSIGYEPDLGEDAQCYECGAWLVRDGKVVIGNEDPWVGVLSNYDPRTAVGIKDDGKLVFVTVDGRQPGVSEGVTGEELGKLLLDLGLKNAAMLDGGASTEMIVKGKIVNKPSFRGEERPLGGGFIIKIDN